MNCSLAAAPNIPNEPLEILAKSVFSAVDFRELIDTRRCHETHEAAAGMQTKGRSVDEEDQDQVKESECQKIMKQIHEKLKMHNNNRGIGTGLERNARWKGTASVVAPSAPTQAGNARNAAEVAKMKTSKAAQKWRRIFTSNKVPEAERLATAGITKLRKLEANGTDFILVVANDKVGIGKVIGLQSKSAAKNARHQFTMSIDNISSASYISIQFFEQKYGSRFTSLTSRTTLVGTNQFEHIPSAQVLCILNSRPQVISPHEIQLGNEDLNIFKNLCEGSERLKLAIAEFRKKEAKETETSG
ncbi:hypothetical protein BDN72DRAFT_966450 [Pluteus cervinus]|uniref:Uncharacterized protein n=1 Tax=Pluteus cervinus TaxID=181527 RepID=A0ACD2ZXD1_9AGAR|nr:hypothetical protein BDN72DRAFT_966450 [Pluteus cervinus]